MIRFLGKITCVCTKIDLSNFKILINDLLLKGSKCLSHTYYNGFLSIFSKI